MSDIESTVDLALKRLAEKPDWKLTCWKCQHQDKVPEDPVRNVYRCSECGSVTAFGAAMPPIANVPHTDRRFITSRIIQPTGPDAGKVFDLTLERGYAAEYAMDLLSVCDPVRWRAIVRLCEAEKALQDAKPATDRVASLDIP